MNFQPTEKTICTTSCAEIHADFGIWEESVSYNPFGLFVRDIGLKSEHVLSVYMGTNCGIYLAIQCQNKACPGFGHNHMECPNLMDLGLLAGRSSCEDYTLANRDAIFTTLLKHGYQYIYNAQYWA